MELDSAVPLRADRLSVIDESFDGEAVLVHLGTGRYYALNAAATEVWQTDPRRARADYVRLARERILRSRGS